MKKDRFMFRSACMGLVLAGLQLTAGLRADDSRLVVGRNQAPFSAALVGIGPKWELQFDLAGETRSLAAADVAYWGQWVDQCEQTVCLLDDESLLTASLIDVGLGELVVESPLWHRTVLPRGRVQGLVLHPPLEAFDRDQLYRRIHAYHHTQDRVWLANGDELTGHLAAIPAGRGIDLFGLAAIYFQLVAGAEPMIIQTENVIALALARAAPPPAPPEAHSAFVAFRDGSCLQAICAERREGEVTLVLGDEIALTADARRVFDEITLVQPLHPDVVYLSALEPLSYRHIPFLDVSWPLGRDQSVAGGLLRRDGRVYRRGLSMHSTSRVVYELAGAYQAFAAELALDARSGRQGSVVYRVFLESPAEGQEAAWRLAYESPIVRGDSEPILMTADVRRARRMALVVDLADQGDTLDHANWLNARLTR